MAAVMPAPAASRVLLSGNEAVARAVWEAGVKVAAAYPGTPSTEMLPQGLMRRSTLPSSPTAGLSGVARGDAVPGASAVFVAT